MEQNFDENQIAILAFAGAMVAIILSIGVLVFFIIYQKKKVQLKLEKDRHEQEILQTQIEIQQQSFENISQEIHDNIGQVLSLIKLNLSRVTEHTVQQPYHQKLVDTLGLAGQVITDLRNLSKGMNPDFVAQFGLAGCIGYELERLQNTGLYETSLAVHGEVFALGLPKEFVLYRVIQECLNNVIKHAKADRVSIEMVYTATDLVLSVIDNGKGFEAGMQGHTVPAITGSGIGNMQKRMHLIGGEFNCNSQPGHGTTITLAVRFT